MKSTFFATPALSLLTLVSAAPSTPPNADMADTSLNPRQIGVNAGCTIARHQTKLVGKGSPKTNTKHVQITHNHGGGVAGGEITREDGIAVSVGFEAAVTPAEWM